MEELLYLDTARVGRMSPGAYRTYTEYLALAAREGGSAYFERFLRAGFDACPDWMRTRHPELACWTGLDGLCNSLRQLAGSRPELPVLLALRSAQLMKLAARLLFRPCRNVLVTDLGWPGYHAILEAECRRSTARITEVPLRDLVLVQRVTEDEVIEAVARVYRTRRCDGLFLPGVSNLGVRLPVARIVRRLEETHEVRLVVVDGAQDFCQLPPGLHDEYCDFYLAGCHKWLGGYHPLGLGFYGHRRSRGFIETTLEHLVAAGEIDDPLLRFAAELRSGRPQGVVETVALGALFSCQGAASDLTTQAVQPTTTQDARHRNADAIAELAAESGWSPLLPDHELRSGILLAQAGFAQVRRAAPQDVRLAFRNAGVGLTAYANGVVRLSMPAVSLGDLETRSLQRVFKQVVRA